MRTSPLVIAALIVVIGGCHPSASVEHTLPVANLQTYRTVALHVRSTAFAAQGQAMSLEAAVRQKLQLQCGFEPVNPAATTPADVMLDLNITRTGRGGGRWLSNENLATMETLLVLTDGASGELLGTARIHGESSGMLINSTQPETEAIDVVAKTVVDLLAKSGCSGPRLAKAQPVPIAHPDPGPNTVAPDESKRPQADALNEQGKDKLRSADIQGALAAFQQANSVLPDARYEFNICLAFETGQQWDQAIAACRQARTMNAPPELVTKIDHRLDLLQHHQ